MRFKAPNLIYVRIKVSLHELTIIFIDIFTHSSLIFTLFGLAHTVITQELTNIFPSKGYNYGFGLPAVHHANSTPVGIGERSNSPDFKFSILELKNKIKIYFFFCCTNRSWSNDNLCVDRMNAWAADNPNPAIIYM